MRNILIIASILFITNVKAQQLQSYVQEAVKNNPEIQAFELRYNIAEEKVNEANWLPDTQVLAGYFFSPTETRTGPKQARFTVTQMLPWFGTIKSREDYALSLADAEYVEILIAKRKLVLSVAQSYYGLYAIRAKQSVLDKNIELLETYETFALKSLEVGNASAVDVLRLQIRQNELVEQKKVLEQDLGATEVEFNNLLNRNDSISVIVVPDLNIPETDPVITVDNLRLNPELIKYDKMYESITQIEYLNQKESMPDIGFGLTYEPVMERSDVNFNDNGKDILMPMVSVSIPIFNKRYKSRTKQNELKQLELTSQKDERRNKLESMLASAMAKKNASRISLHTQKANLQQANDAEEVLLRRYETATIDFNDVLDIQELQLKFQINCIESVKNYYSQMAIINYLSNNN